MKRSKKKMLRRAERDLAGGRVTGVYMGGEDGEEMRLEGEEAKMALAKMRQFEREAEEDDD